MKKKKFSELVVVILIVLFFAILLCSLALNESVIHWPTHPTRLIYNSLFK